MQDIHKMEMTLNLAQEALEHGEMPIASILFQGEQVIAKAYTSENKDRRFLVHAELKTLLEADQRHFSVAERRQMQLFTNLEPCLMCFGAAMSFFVGEVVYSLNADDDGAMKLVHFENFSGDLVHRQRPTIRGGILKIKAKEQFEKYAKIEQRKYLKEFAEMVLQSNSSFSKE